MDDGQLPLFDGETFDPVLDGKRLLTQFHRVFRLMSDGKWRTLATIAHTVQGSPASVSARLRDFRKERFGGHTVLRRRISGGLYKYRLVLPAPNPQPVQTSLTGEGVGGGDAPSQPLGFPGALW